MARKGGKRVGQLVDDLVSIGAAEIAGMGVPEKLAREIALQIAHRLCAQYARAYLYVPALMELELTARDEEIFAKYQKHGPKARAYSSNRAEELAGEYKLTTRQIYSIIALQNRRLMVLRQGHLPGFEAAT